MSSQRRIMFFSESFASIIRFGALTYYTAENVQFPQSDIRNLKPC